MANQEELELAKAGVEQLGETGREMVRLAADSSAASEAGGLLADGLRLQRFKRQLRIVKKAEELVDEAGLSARAVPLKTLAPLVAWGSLEDDEEMIGRWANLLASASSGSGFHVVYPDLLRQLEPTEARIIDALFLLEKSGGPVDPQVWRLKRGAWRKLSEVMQEMDDRQDTWVEVDARNLENLVRLRLCELRGAPDDLAHFMKRGMRIGSQSSSSFGELEVHLTALGLEFSLVCQPPSKLG
jgi:hypothetical protein